jgi:hypothetical protein
VVGTELEVNALWLLWSSVATGRGTSERNVSEGRA